MPYLASLYRGNGETGMRFDFVRKNMFIIQLNELLSFTSKVYRSQSK